MQTARQFLIFIFQQIISAHAQTITIISAHTNEPLPFATIQNLRAQWVMVGSEKGVFTFSEANSKPGDSILISFTGYLPIRMVKPEIVTIFKMEPLTEMLKPVEVLPCKGIKISTLRNFKNNKSDISFASNENGLTTYAAYIPNSHQVNGIISKIQFSLNVRHVPKTAAGAPFKVRLLSYNQELNLPGIPLLMKELVVYPTGKEVIVNITDEWIRLSDGGIVIAIDFFFADKKFVYSSKYTYTRDNGKKADTVVYNYGPDIKFLKGENMVGKGFSYDYKNNKWREMKYSQEEHVPKIELTLKLCD